jgi:DNA polymerase-3 subunit delta
MNLNELEKELAKGHIRPAYLLSGEEPLLRDDAFAAIKRSVLEGVAEDFNFDRLSGESATPAALQDATRALPVMAPRRLVLLVEPEKKRGNAKLLTDALVDILGELSQQKETVLVVIAPKVDGRSRWVKAFAKDAAQVACDPPKGGKTLSAFVRAEADRQGVAIEGAAADLLAERIGPQLLMLRQEIAKAALLAGEGETVSRAHVEVSASLVAEEPIWDLTDAIGAGRAADAVMILARLMAQGAVAQPILATLAGHFRKLARARSGAPLAGPPFVVKKLQTQASRYTSRRLLACLRAIHDTDLALKGAGTLSPQLTLERLVIGLAS